MNTIKALVLVCILVSGASHAQVRKCTGPDGKITYSDFVCAGGTKTESSVRTEANVIDSSGYRRDAQQMKEQESVDRAMQNESSKCKFEYLALGDDKGKALAAAAKQECLSNIRAKATGQPTSLEAYNFWKDHHTQKTTQRQRAVDRAVAQDNANATRQAIENSQNSNNNFNRGFTCRKNVMGDALDCR